MMELLKSLVMVNAWQNRALETVYPLIFIDAILYGVKDQHQDLTKAAYVVLGIDMDGNKDILGVWIGEHESSEFWLSVLNDLKSRGVMEVYLFCIDRLQGFRESIADVYPKAQIQRCNIHQICSASRDVGYKDIKNEMPDLKLVYKAVADEEAHEKDKWGKQYPACESSGKEEGEIARVLDLGPKANSKSRKIKKDDPFMALFKRARKVHGDKLSPAN